MYTFSNLSSEELNGIVLKCHHKRIEACEVVAGITLDHALPDENVGVIVSDYRHSSDNEFGNYMRQLWCIYVGSEENPIFYPDLLVLLHEDKSADVYYGVIKKKIGVRCRRRISKGELIHHGDLADVVSLQFDDIPIKQNDKVIYCFRHEWSFGLYFDLSDRDMNAHWPIERLLGAAHRYVMFHEQYRIFESNYGKMALTDGWFPFNAIISNEYSRICNFYSDNAKKDSLVSSVLDSFTQERIAIISELWWTNAIFISKKPILEAAIDAYLRSDYINCIKNLYSEIEGILRIKYFGDKTQKPTFKQMLTHLSEIGNLKYDSASIVFPVAFYDYMDKVVFAGFDLTDSDIALSRHSTSHGVANANAYTKEKAVQAILTLDQLSYFIG